MSFAKAVISGLVATEPEKRFTPNNHAVTTFDLAVDSPGNPSRPGGSEPFMVRITCWRNLADAAEAGVHKGDYLLVEGKLILGNVQTPDGAQRKYFELEATSLDKLPGRPDPIMPISAASSAPRGNNGYAPQQAQPSTGGYGQASGYASTPPQPVPSTVGSQSHFSSEDLLTEDDIPF